MLNTAPPHQELRLLVLRAKQTQPALHIVYTTCHPLQLHEYLKVYCSLYASHSIKKYSISCAGKLNDKNHCNTPYYDADVENKER